MQVSSSGDDAAARAEGAGRGDGSSATFMFWLNLFWSSPALAGNDGAVRLTEQLGVRCELSATFTGIARPSSLASPRNGRSGA